MSGSETDSSRGEDVWNLDNLHESFQKQARLLLFVGKSGSGKSFAMQQIVHNMTKERKYFQFGLVMSGSKAMNDDWKFLPSQSVWTGFSEEKFRRYIEVLEAHKKKVGKKMPASFIVFDDLLGQLNKSSYFDSFISRYRHLNVSIFMGVQYLKNQGSSTLIREQTEYLFSWTSNSANTLKAFYEFYAGKDFASYRDFVERFSACTAEKHRAMLWSNSAPRKEDNWLSFLADPDYKLTKISFPRQRKNEVIPREKLTQSTPVG